MQGALGPLRQNGYVVRDIEEAIAFWTRAVGVGPFFLIDPVPLRSFRYRGEAFAPDVAIALANSGPLQIELIQPRDDTPSMYRDFLASGREGLQHVAFWPEDYDAAVARMEADGFVEGQAGEIGRRGRFAYYARPGEAERVIELSEVSGAKGRFFAEVRDAAASWDGRDPVRRP